jgi:uncharacterized repeat protein (TIGR02543 family)
MKVREDAVSLTYVAKYNALPYSLTFVEVKDGEEKVLTDSQYVGIVYYDAIYNVNDNVWNNDDESFVGRTVKLPATPVQIGHTGNWTWSDGLSAGGSLKAGAKTWDVPAGILADLTLTVRQTPNKYKVSFDTHGVTVLESIAVTYGQAYGNLPTNVYTPNGYTFVGWYLSDDYSGEKIDNQTLFEIAEDTVLYAKYCITVELDHGTGLKDSQVFVYNSTNYLPKLENDGAWTFVGWYGENQVITPDEEGVIKIENYTSLLTSYKACWSREINLNVGEFAVNHETVTVYRDSSASITANITDLGSWELNCWYCTTASGTRYVFENGFIPVEIVNGSITEIFAEYKSAVTVIFDVKKDDQEPVKESFDVILGGILFSALDSEYEDYLVGFEGYNHVGWKIGEKTYKKGDYPTDGINKSFGGAEVIAVFEPVTYTVEFEVDTDEYTNETENPQNLKAEFDVEYTDLPKPTRPGYTFGGWYSDPNFADDKKINSIHNLASVPDAAVTLYAKWVPNQYTVKYEVAGGIIEGDAYGEPDNYHTCATYNNVFVLPTPVRTGYIFGGWYFGSTEQKNGNIVTENGAEITLVAKWIPITYNVEFDSCGGAEVETITDIEYGTKQYTGTTTRNWYKFDGWYLDKEYSGEKIEEFTNLTSIDGDTVTLYAKWVPVKYKLMYVVDSETVLEIEYDITDTYYYQPEVPAKKGYVGSWDMSGMPFANDQADNPGDRTVEPKYIAIVYKINFYVSGEVFKTLTYTVETAGNADKPGILDEAEIIPIAPSIAGYTFVGWDKTNADILALKDTLGNLDVTAVYTPIEYKLIYNDTNGIKIDEATFTLDDVALPEPPTIVLSGYRYEWNFSRDDILARIVEIGEDAEKVINVSPTLIPIVYTVFVDNGSGIIEYSYTADLGSVLKLVVADPGADYEYVVLSGATLSSYDREKGILTLAVDTDNYSDVFVGVKKSETQTYTLILDYAIGNDYISAAVGEGITLPEITRKGYILEGWVYNGSLVQNGDVIEASENDVITLTAVWQPIRYSVTLNVNGGYVEVPEFEAVYDVSAEIETPVREGYIFLGWKLGDKLINSALNLTFVNEDNVILTAEWKAVTYNVVFDSDGGNKTPSNTAVKYDENLQLPYDLTRPGYILIGWECGDKLYKGSYASNLSAVNGSTVTLKAKWQAITYTVVFADSSLEDVVLTYDEAYTFPGAERTGYKFLKWQYTLNGKIHTSNKDDTIPNLTTVDGAVVTVTAIWAKDNYTVKFHYTTYQDESMEQSDSVAFIDEYSPEYLGISLEGYVVGWTPYFITDGTLYYETSAIEGSIADGWVSVIYVYEGRMAYRIYKDGEVELDEIAPVIPAKEGYKAEWIYAVDSDGNYTATVSYSPENNEEYTVIFNTGCSESLDSLTVFFGDKIVLEPLERIGYKFVGWKTLDASYTCGEEVDVNPDGEYAVVTLTAEWELISYTITFIGVGETSTYTVETLPSEITLPDVIPSKVGHIGKWVLPTLTYGDISVRPEYTPITYTVVFDLNGGAGDFADLSVNYGSLAVLGVPTRDGYVFDGWEYDGVVYSGIDAVIMTLADTEGAQVEITAVWSNTYVATFISGDKVYEVIFTDKDIANGYIIPPELEEREHYNVYWEEYTLAPHDITVEAIYVPILYKIEYVEGENVICTIYYTVETTSIPNPTIEERIGYIAKCSDIPDGIGDKTVAVEYYPISYTVVFDSNGGNSVESIDATYDVSGTLPSATRDGYEFVGWELDGVSVSSALNFTCVDGSEVTLVAKWQATEYELVFEATKGESVKITYTVETPIDEIYAQHPDVEMYIEERKGYTADWEIITKLVPGGMTVKPVYTEITYYVVFDFGVGYESKLREWTVSSGAITEYAANEGYVWKRFDVETETYVDYVLDVDRFVFNEETERYELVLYQVRETKVHKVLFMDGKSLIATRYYNISVGTTITLPGLPTKSGYVDGRWNISEIITLLDGHITVSEDGMSITINSLPDGFDEYYPESGIVINAEYTAIQFTVVYDVNGGEDNSELVDILATYISRTRISTVKPVRTGYRFVGWTYDGYEGSDPILSGAQVYLRFEEHGGTLTLVAVWEPITYIVEIIENSVSTIKSEVIYDDFYVLPEATVSKAYHVFYGWKIGETVYNPGDKVYNLSATDGGTVDIHAMYVPEEYKISFVSGGVTVDELTYTVETKPDGDLPLVPDRDHYFGVWMVNDNGEWKLFADYVLTNGDLTVEAVYTAKKYALVYHDGNNVVLELEYTVENTEITPPEAPEREGYEGSWPEVILDGGNKTVYAVYTPVIYKVYFYSGIDGEVISVSTYTV